MSSQREHRQFGLAKIIGGSRDGDLIAVELDENNQPPRRLHLLDIAAPGRGAGRQVRTYELVGFDQLQKAYVYLR